MPALSVIVARVLPVAGAVNHGPPCYRRIQRLVPLPAPEGGPAKFNEVGGPQMAFCCVGPVKDGEVVIAHWDTDHEFWLI
jgi:hypothetical protein